MNELSPCLHCTRVKNHRNCENKNCKPWQKWFAGSWENTRRLFRRGMDVAPALPAGVPLGGRRYDSPHRTTEYLETDPCDRCKLSSDLCHTPCRARLNWCETRKKVRDELEK